MVLRDAEFRVDINTAYLAVLGCTREEVLGRDSVLGHDAAELDRLLSRATPACLRASRWSWRPSARAGRPALRPRAARCPGAVLRQAARPLHRPRHQRAQAHRGGAAGERGAVPLDLQRVPGHDGAARRRFPHRRRQRAMVAVTGFSREETLGQDRVLGADPPEFEQYLRAQHHKVLAGEIDGARDRARAHERPARGAGAARGARAPPGQAARALHRPRHRRAQARRGGAARERGAVPRIFHASPTA